jgi:hypothetical protein
MCMPKAPKIEAPAPQAPPPLAPLALESPTDTPAAARKALNARRSLRNDLAIPVGVASGLQIPK